MKKFILSLCVIFAAVLLMASVVPVSGAEAAISDEDFLELCVNGTPEDVERAIRGGANVNAADEDDWTALHFAALSNANPAVLEILLENGANVDARDDSGDTPLINAAIRDWPKHIFLLLDFGADAGITNNDGNKAVDHLSESKPDEVDEAEWEAVVERLKKASE